jgi:fructose-bisphosphate aldolase class I
MEYLTELESTVNDMVQKGRGILAADESSPTIAKRFKAIDVESTEELRRAWRSLLVNTAGLGDYISGIILFEETLGQKTDEGKTIPEAAWAQKIVPGIKVDKGKVPLALSPGDLITLGLDGLAERLRGYRQQGARFAKWREVYSIDKHAPTQHGIEANAEMLARYAAVCQAEGVVPIVEPEVLMDGDHDIERHAEVTEAVQHAVFHALHRHNVSLELMILKPNMGLPPGRTGRSGCRNPESVAPYRTGCRAQHKLSVRRPGAGRSHRQSECVESTGPRRALAAKHFVRPRPATDRLACMAWQDGERTSRATGPAQACAAQSSGHAG